MREIQASEVKARLPHYLDQVERGETLIITRHGKPIARLVPEQESKRDQIRGALEEIAVIRKSASKMSTEEILAARHDGHKY